MGILQQDTGGRRVSLPIRCLVGRATYALVQLCEGTVSAEHAVIYYTGGAWRVRDLGSRNGTTLNGQSLLVGRPKALKLSDRLQFGRGPGWVLIQDEMPGPSARSPGRHCVATRSAELWLPESDLAVAHVSMTEDRWVFESEDSRFPVVDGDEVTVGNVTWTLELPPSNGVETQQTPGTMVNAREASVHMIFTVSSDEEHVQLEARLGEKDYLLGARGHNYALLLLARRRIQESAVDVSDEEAGWMQVSELQQMLGVDRENLNLQIFRAKRCFQQSGLPSSDLIERRADSGQVRLGVKRLTITENAAKKLDLRSPG